MRTTILPYASAIALVAALSACGGGSANNTVPTPSATCGPGGLQAALVNPQPNSTVSAAATSTVTFAVSASLPANGDTWHLVFSPSTNPGDLNARESANAAFVVATPPPNSATPPFANPIYEQVQLSSNLSTGTNNVFLDQPNTLCVPIGPFGSFTAQ